MDKQPSSSQKPSLGIPSSAIQNFFSAYDAAKEEEVRRAERLQKIAEEKQKILAPIKHFFRGLTTMGVQLKDGRLFQFYEKESSPTWAPGVSLMFDHPAEIEIAVPNSHKKDGAVVVAVVTEKIAHRELLQKRFETVAEALDAIASFLGNHTKRMDIDPRYEANLKQRVEEREMRRREEASREAIVRAEIVDKPPRKMQMPEERESKNGTSQQAVDALIKLSDSASLEGVADVGE